MNNSKLLESNVKEKFFKCICGSHGLEIIHYTEFFEDSKANFEEFYFNCWELGRNNDNIMGFKERLRWCWQILKTGNPFADSISLSKIQIKDIINFLYNEVKDPNSPEKVQ